jgi:hypothetical protein
MNKRLPLLALLLALAAVVVPALFRAPIAVDAARSGIATDASLAVTADEQGYSGTGGQVLYGFAVRESAASAAVATVILRKGTADSGTAIAPIELNPNESAREWFDPGIDTPGGVYIDHVAGTADVVLFYKD